MDVTSQGFREDEEILSKFLASKELFIRTVTWNMCGKPYSDENRGLVQTLLGVNRYGFVIHA
jgi:hypothetical protein